MLQNQPNLLVLYTDTRLADLLYALDQIHTAASDDELHTVTPLSGQDVVEWLQDIIYTAQEAITEIKQSQPQPKTPRLRVVEKVKPVEQTEGRDAS